METLYPYSQQQLWSQKPPAGGRPCDKALVDSQNKQAMTSEQLRPCHLLIEEVKHFRG